MPSRNRGRRFRAAVAAAFLKLRQHRQRLRAAAVRGLTGSTGAAASEPAVVATAGLAAPLPRLSIVILVVGSRGDVQPFIPIARRLAQEHRVRLATHAEFRPMVEAAGLEFYPLAGDPRALMEYIVKTGGRIVPTHVKQFVEDVPKKRAMIADILASTWRACTEPDPGRPDAPAFRADVILANPPSYGHLHCAEALHVPLHMIFTMPWSPTSAVPHPFARIDPTAHGAVQNFMSYGVVDLLVWSGIADLVNTFREQTLKLPALSLAEGTALLEDHEVPFTYLWSPSLLPKPPDWGPHIDVANFTFYDQAHRYEPPRALLDFLAAGEAPIYIGFGSVVVGDPAALRRIVFDALKESGARGIVSDGWAHLAGEAPPPNVFLIGDCPHDWLFPRCRAVCHHGGAGTTAAGLRAGLPTVIVPFFGDQFLWGQLVVDAGAGPRPIPFDQLDRDRLTAAFDACRRPQLRERASAVGAAVRDTDGVELTVRSIYRQLSTQPQPYADWSARAHHGVAAEIGELLGEAAQAVRAGFAEAIRPDLVGSDLLDGAEGRLPAPRKAREGDHQEGQGGELAKHEAPAPAAMTPPARP